MKELGHNELAVLVHISNLWNVHHINFFTTHFPCYVGYYPRALRFSWVEREGIRIFLEVEKDYKKKRTQNFLAFHECGIYECSYRLVFKNNALFLS